MEINCLSCGHRIDIGDAYDDFEGQVRCFVCAGLLQIKTKGGQRRRVNVGHVAGPARLSEEEPPSSENQTSTHSGSRQLHERPARRP